MENEPASEQLPEQNTGMPETSGREPSNYRGGPSRKNSRGGPDKKKNDAPSRSNLRDREQAGMPAGGSTSQAADDGLQSAENSGGFYKPSQKNSRRFSLKTNRTRWAILGGGLSMAVIAVFLLLAIFLPSLKIPQLAADILELRMVRISRTFARESSILSTDRATVTDSQIPAEYKTTKLGSLFGAFKPSLVINNMKGQGVLQFKYEPGPLGTTKISSVVLNGQEIQAPEYKFGRVISNYQERLRFAAQVNGAMAEILKGNSYLVRSAVSKKLLSGWGISLSWYQKLGSKYRGLKKAAADQQMLKDTEQKISTPTTEDSVLPDAANTAKKATQDLTNCEADGACAAQLESSNQLPQQVQQDINNGASSLLGKTFLKKTLSIANPLYGIGMPLCIVYDGSVDASKTFINNQTVAAIKTFLAVESAADQQKANGVTAEAVQAFNDRVGNVANSIPEQAASGQAVDTSAEVPPEAGKSGELSVFNLLGLGGLNSIANNVCPVITNTTVSITIAVGNVITAVFTGGGSTLGEQSAADVADAGITGFIKGVTSKIAEKFVTVQGRASLTNTARQFAVGYGVSKGEVDGLTYLTRMLILSEMGAFYSGTDSHDFANQADAGGVEYANTLGRQEFYGRPLTNSENNTLTYQDNQYLASQKAGMSNYQKLFSLSNPNSAFASMVVSLSGFKLSSLTSYITHLPHYFVSGFSSLSNLVFGHTLAATTSPNSNYGVVQWGWSADEENLINNDPTYDPLENAKILADPANAANVTDLETQIGKCYNSQIGDLLSTADVPRDKDGNVVSSGGDCSPQNLSFNSTASYAQDYSSETKHPQDLVFRWRLDQSYQNTLGELTGIQNPSADVSTSPSPTQPANPSPGTGTNLNINANAATSVAKKAGANVGFALVDSSGHALARYNDSFENYGASITKSMALVAYLRQVGDKALSSKATSNLTGMIEQSSDSDANYVLGLLSNPQSELEQVAKDAGMSGFKFNIEGDSLYWLGQSQITAADFAKFFAKIDALVPASHKTFALNLLSNISPQAGLLQAGLPGTIYSKEGWKPEPGGGAISARKGSPNPFGLEGSPYVVNQAAQFSAGGKTYGLAVTVGGTTNEISGETIIKNVVQALVGSQ